MNSFSTMLRPALLAAGRSPRLERALPKVPLTRHVVNRFVAGEEEYEAISAAHKQLNSGRYVSIDYLGEDTLDRNQANTAVAHYLALLPALAQLSDTDDDSTNPRPSEVSLKLSALGQFLPRDGHAIALDHARTICAAAKQVGVWVTVDAEDHTTTDSTLSIVDELRRDFPDLGTVLQAYLRRTEGDCRELAGPGSRIRLCKGAYQEPASVAHQGLHTVNDAYLRCLRILMRGQGYPMVATHDPLMIEAALREAAKTGRTANDFELQMLYGVREVEQRRIVAAGQHLRCYIPYGEQWFGYFMRRLAERPANLSFFLRSLISRR